MGKNQKHCCNSSINFLLGCNFRNEVSTISGHQSCHATTFFSYNLPFNIFNPVVQLLLIIWTLISTPIAIIIYFIELMNAKDRNFPTGAHFRKLLGYFIRLKLFPRKLPELLNVGKLVESEQKTILASL